MKMERAYPPTTDSQLTSPLLIGEQGIFILCDASGAKRSDEKRLELETLVYESLTSYFKGMSGPIDDAVLQDAFDEANVRLMAATSENPTPLSALVVVKEEGASNCLVASAGKCKLLRVDGDRVELAISHSKQGKDKPKANSLGIKDHPPLYLAKVELGADEVLVALGEEAYKAQNLDSWKNRLASPDTLTDEVQRALGMREGTQAWILYPHEDSVPALPPKRRGLTFSVSLILLACLAILGTSVWMKERRTLLGRATPPSAHIAEALVQQERHPLTAAQILDDEASFDFATQELEIAQLRDAIQEVAEVGGDEGELLKRIVAAQEDKIAQMSDKEAALTHKLESQGEYINLLQASLALLQEGASGPADTLSLQLSEALESKDMLERELESIAAHTALLDQHREEVARLRLEAEEYEETRSAYEEVIRYCAIQSEELAALETKFADEELALNTVRGELAGSASEADRLRCALAEEESAKQELATLLDQEKQAASINQEQLTALASRTELQEEQLSEYRQIIEELKAGAVKTVDLDERCSELIAQLETLNQERNLLSESAESLQSLLTDQEATLMSREASILELQEQFEEAAAMRAASEKKLSDEQALRQAKEELLANFETTEKDRGLKLQETEGARAILAQQIDELTDSHRLLHTEKRNLEARVEMLDKDLRDRESRLAVAELEQQKLKDATIIAEEAHRVLQKENLSLGEKIASLEKVETDYAKEHLLRRESDEMLGRLASNIQGWKEAVSSMEDSRKALAEELAELKAYQSETLRGKVKKASDKTEKKPSVTRIHLVSPGETLEGISRRYYGTTKKIDQLREANEDLLAEGQQVRVGTALVIP